VQIIYRIVSYLSTALASAAAWDAKRELRTRVYRLLDYWRVKDRSCSTAVIRQDSEYIRI